MMSAVAQLLHRTLLFGALLALVSGVLLLSSGSVTAQDKTVRVLDVEGPITPVMANYVERGIESAGEDGDAAVLIQLDTPGGLTSAMDRIVNSIIRGDVPVIVYVSPEGARAASAGGVAGASCAAAGTARQHRSEHISIFANIDLFSS